MERSKADPIRLRVTTSSAADSLNRRSLPGRKQFVRHLLFWLCPTGIKKALTYQGITFKCADTNEHADVVIEVLERERKPENSRHHSVSFCVTAGRYTGVHYALADGGQWNEVAHNAARHIRRWIVEHYESLIADRSGKGSSSLRE